MESIKLNAKERKSFSKSEVKTLRKDGFVPGVYYHQGDENIHFYVKEREVLPLIYTDETHIVELFLDGEDKGMGIIREFQFDPVTDKCIHFDITGIKRGQTFTTEVPIATKGTAIGVREGGVLQVNYHTLQIRVLPRFLPEHIEIDVSGMNIGDVITAGDLQVDNIEILNDHSIPVVTVIKKRSETEISTESAETVSAEVPTLKDVENDSEES